jgi:nucleoside-diphosphate-sugar epimerase
LHLLIFGLGYCGKAVAARALAAGIAVTATSRQPGGPAVAGVRMVAFEGARSAIASATHILATAPPGPAGDPVLARYAGALREAPAKWFGYLSTTGVYGDRGGGWVDEDTEPAPTAARSQRRLEAELAWRACAAGRPLALFRVAGIYGPGRSALDEVRSGRARRVIRPGHAFGRIHRDDIAAAVLAGMMRPAAGTRVLNLSDDRPAESALVIEEAARLLGLPPPPAVPFDEAYAGMSDMARSFWADDRRVSSARTQSSLGIRWAYPSFVEGLRAIHEQEVAGGPNEERQILRP